MRPPTATVCQRAPAAASRPVMDGAMADKATARRPTLHRRGDPQSTEGYGCHRHTARAQPRALVVELVSLVDDDTGSARDRLSLSACRGARGVRAAHEARQTRQSPAPGHIVDRGGPRPYVSLSGLASWFHEVGFAGTRRATGDSSSEAGRTSSSASSAAPARGDGGTGMPPAAQGRTAAGLCIGARCRPSVGRRRMPNEWSAPASVPCSVPDAGRYGSSARPRTAAPGLDRLGDQFAVRSADTELVRHQERVWMCSW
jgi:hypothetical protein